MKNLKLVSFAILGFVATAMISCSAPKEEAATEDSTAVVEVAPVEAPKTVVDIAVGSADHSTLVAAVTTAGLAETLSGTGPFTIFAPTNAAFLSLIHI